LIYEKVVSMVLDGLQDATPVDRYIVNEYVRICQRDALCLSKNAEYVVTQRRQCAHASVV
jgi:hypothetical protein